MKPPILFAIPIRPPVREALEDRYELLGPLDRDKPLPLPAGADRARALVTLGGLRTNAELMDALPELRLICCYGTGYEGVDRAEAQRRGIVVTHAGDANATAVAEYAMGLVLAASRNVVRGDRLLRAGAWPRLAQNRVPYTPGLAGRRMGIYGLGAIGSRIASRAAAFEMEIGYHNRSRCDVPYAYFDSLRDLARWCDILVVSVRAGAENRHAIDAEILGALGPEGVLVNISRGLVVDETALCEALEAGRILAAALDVFQNEPHVSERLWPLENAVLSPHIAPFSYGARDAQQKVLVDTLDAFFSGRPIRSKVPMPG